MASRYKGSLTAFRIARARFPIFDGTGAALAGARWNARGQPVIYAADSYAGALLEILVHSNLGRVPRGFSWIKIHIPGRVEIEEITASDLPGWDAADCCVSQEFGSRWHTEMRTAVLLVPSVPANAMGRNVLINPDHAQFRFISASRPRAVAWDKRLFQQPRHPRQPDR